MTEIKSKLIKFFVLLLLIIAIPFVAIGIYQFQKYQASIYESKAIIANAQSDIIIARGQRNINNAVAYQTYAVSTIVVILALLPYMLLFTVVIYTMKVKHEKIQSRINSNTTTD